MHYVSEVNIVDFKQYGVTHWIVKDEKWSKPRFHLQGIKKALPVFGLEQIDSYGDTYEIANAKLFKDNCDDYYILLTVYYDREELEAYRYMKGNLPEDREEIGGLDLGCKDTATESDGTVHHIVYEKTERAKKLQRKLSKKQKDSNAYYKTKLNLNREERKRCNRKDESAQQLKHHLLDKYTILVMQDENLKAWQAGNHGKAVANGILGRLKSLLSSDARVVVLDKFVPTTKFDYHTGTSKDVPLNQREFTYDWGEKEQRDTRSARAMVFIYLNFDCVLRVEPSKKKKKRIGSDGSESCSGNPEQFKRDDFDNAADRLFRSLFEEAMSPKDIKWNRCYRSNAKIVRGQTPTDATSV